MPFVQKKNKLHMGREIMRAFGSSNKSKYRRKTPASNAESLSAAALQLLDSAITTTAWKSSRRKFCWIFALLCFALLCHAMPLLGLKDSQKLAELDPRLVKAASKLTAAVASDLGRWETPAKANDE